MGSYIGRSPANELFQKSIVRYNGDGSTKDFGLGLAVNDGNDLDVWVANVHQTFGANQAFVVTPANSTINFIEAPPAGQTNIVIVNREKQRFATIAPDDFSVTTNKVDTGAITDDKLSTTFSYNVLTESGKFGNFAGANLVIGTIEVSTKGRISNVANLNVKDLDFSGIPTGGGSVVAGRLYKESNNLIFIKT
jgi:hypothetical protein|tara:strand:+ start:2845 stop:3423 length:579 start_codon:yes stop_codon:yes gene_type:complete